MNCAKCRKPDCYRAGKDCSGHRDAIAALYKNQPHSRPIMEAAAAIEAAAAMLVPRVEEVALFAIKMEYRHIGIAFCAGLHKEAGVLESLLEKHFRITSVCCKVCGLSQDTFSPTAGSSSAGTMCNPIGQAHLLNEDKTDLNIMLGLCVGHDILFTQSSQAPVTTLVVKDRVLANNPAGVFYSPYWKEIIKNRLTTKKEMCDGE